MIFVVLDSVIVNMLIGIPQFFIKQLDNLEMELSQREL